MHALRKTAQRTAFLSLLCLAAIAPSGCFGPAFRPSDANWPALGFVRCLLNGEANGEEDPRQYLDDQFEDPDRLNSIIEALKEPRDDSGYLVFSGRGCTLTFVSADENARTVDLQASLNIRDIDIPHRTVTDSTPTKDGIPVIAREMIVRMVLSRGGWKVLSFEPTERPRPFKESFEFK